MTISNLEKKEKDMSNIQVEKLTKTYGSGATAVTALDRVNLTIREGEFVAIMGPSGCGKSTLLHLLGGLDKPSAGQVLIAGHNLGDLNDDNLTQLRRRKIGFVFQLLDGAKPADAKARATTWLTKFGLADRLHNRPDQLSGGQQQRVAIARALVADPDLILADEPTGNLDTRSSDEIASLLRDVAKEYKRTVVMVTHDPRIAAYADRIIFLKDGKVVDETILERKTSKSADFVAGKVKEMGD